MCFWWNTQLSALQFLSLQSVNICILWMCLHFCSVVFCVVSLTLCYCHVLCVVCMFVVINLFQDTPNSVHDFIAPIIAVIISLPNHEGAFLMFENQNISTPPLWPRLLVYSQWMHWSLVFAFLSRVENMFLKGFVRSIYHLIPTAYCRTTSFNIIWYIKNEKWNRISEPQWTHGC